MRLAFSMAISIDAGPERVWSYLVDWEHLDRWMKEASDFTMTSAQREGVGVEALATIKIAGITTRDPVRVSQWEPPSLLAIEHRGWVKGTGVMRCAADGRGTQMTWVETYRPPLGLLGGLGMWLLRPLFVRIFTRDLRLLKDLVEHEHPPDNAARAT